MAEDIARKDAERDEMERIRMELHLEEQEERERQKERELLERRIRQRLELQGQHAQQMHFKQLRQQAEKEEEENFRQQVSSYPTHLMSLATWLPHPLNVSGYLVTPPTLDNRYLLVRIDSFSLDDRFNHEKVSSVIFPLLLN